MNLTSLSYYDIVGHAFESAFTEYVFICGNIFPGRVEPESPMELAVSLIEAARARRSCARSLEIYTQSFLNHA